MSLSSVSDSISWHVRFNFPDLFFASSPPPFLFPLLYSTTGCLFFFFRGENEQSICVVLFSSCAAFFFSSPCCYSFCHSPQAALSPSPCQHSETTLLPSSVLCVTHHSNKCVCSFEDCHDRARLLNLPPHIAVPNAHCCCGHFC